MPTAETFAPLRELLPNNIEGIGQLASVPGLTDLLDGLYYKDAWVDSSPTESLYTVVLALFDGVAIQLPWLPGLEFRIGTTADEPVLVEVECAISDGWRLRAKGIPLQITLPPEILARADDPARGSSVTITADIAIDDDLHCQIEVTDSIDLPLSLVGGTTLGIELQGLSFDLGATDERRGISARVARIKLPKDLLDAPLELTFEDFFIGEGGLSGRVSWTAPTGPEAPVWHEQQRRFSGIGTGNLFGSLPISVRRVSIELLDSIPRQGSIVAYAFVPFFEQVIAVEASVGSGNLELVLAAALEAQPEGTPVSASGLVSLRRDDVLTVALTSLGIALQDGRVTIEVRGTFTPLFGGLDWPTFQIDNLTIDSDGKVTIDGGWIDVGKQGTVEFNGAVLEISKLGFGSEDDGTRWIGFSGGLKLADPLPVSGSVEGLRINWRGDDVWLELRGAAVGFEIPNSVKFDGHLEFVEDPVEPRGPEVAKQRGFRGGGSLIIVPTNMKINAEVIVGKSMEPPPYPFAYLFVDFQTPVGIPMGLPNVAIYGLSGLLGLSMEPKKDANQAWWEHWYLLPAPGVSSSTKWRPERGAFALGTGVTLGTAADNGYAVHGRLLLVLLLPGPTLLLEGVAGFLEDRTALGDDSPIHALAVMDTRAGQFLMNVRARYPFTSSDPMNKLIQVRGGAETLFDAGGDWHFFLGERDPRNKRVLAEILQLFEARSYMMLVPDRVGLGVWVGLDRKWKFGPLKVRLEAWMDSNARISWRPVQYAGDLKLVGNLGLKAFGIGVSLNVRTEVAAQAPAPYKVHAEIEAKLRTPRFIPDPKCHIEWDYEQPATPAIPPPIGRLGLEHLKVSERWSLEGADTEAGAPVVPLDAKVALSFERSVEDAPLVGGTSISGIPPWERSGRHEFAYRLTKVQLERRAKGTTGGAWENVATRMAGDAQTDADRLWGAWLAVDGDSASGEPTPNAPMTKLLLHASSPFEYARENVDETYFDHFTERHPDYGWIRVTPPEPVCFGFDDLVTEKPVPRELIQRGEVLILGQNLLVEPGPRVDGGPPGPAHLRMGVHTPGSTHCVQFQTPGPGPNPRVEEGLLLQVRDYRGDLPAQTRVKTIGGFTGLDCDRRLEVRLSMPSPRVELALVNFSGWAATLEAFNADGTLADTGTTSGTRAQPETLLLDGASIAKVVVTAPQNEVLLLKFCAVRAPGVLICFPEPVRVATLTFRSAHLNAELYYGPQLVSTTPIQVSTLQTVSVGALDGPNWTTLALSLVLQGQSPGLLVSLCFVTAEEADRFANEDESAEDAANADDHLDDPPGSGLLLPQSYYRLTIVAEGRRRRRGESSIDTQEFQRVAYFQTADPPGVFDAPGSGGLAPDAQAQQYPAAGPLKDLAPYVATTPENDRAGPDDVRRTTPADGALAVYRSYDVGIEFNEAYVEQMYLSAGMPLVLSLYDTNGRRVGSTRLAATTLVLPAIGSTWQEAEVQPGRRALEQHVGSAEIAQRQIATSDVVTSDERAVLGPAELMALGTSIVYIAHPPDPQDVPPASAIWTGGADFILEPRTLYRAALEAVRPGAVVHLDPRGVPLKAADGSFRVDRVASDGSNLKQILEDPAGLAETGSKVMTDGRSLIAHAPLDMPAGGQAPPDVPLVLRAFEEAGLAMGAPQSAPQVFYWNFTSSRFVSFVHHAHSFVDLAWDRRATLATPWDVLDDADRDALAALVQAPGDGKELHETAAALFALGSDPLPERLEVQLLKDAGGRYGFLIESPEPLDWERGGAGRVGIAVTYAPDTMTAGLPAFGQAKLVGCRLGGAGWVEILVRDNADLTGWTVECASAEGAAPSLYYTFPAGSVVPAGTVLRLYAGAAPDPLPAGEHVAVSTGADPALLPATGVILALKDARGGVVHRRQFLPDARFAKSYAARLAADADGTRTFVFLLDGGAYVRDMPAGTYRMSFDYRRTGAGRGRRTLRRNGSTTPEATNLTVGV